MIAVREGNALCLQIGLLLETTAKGIVGSEAAVFGDDAVAGAGGVFIGV